MAPRRGGGGGGGGGGGSGLKGPWGDEYQFYGSKFTDPIARGTIIIQGICLFALLVIAITVLTIKKSGYSKKENAGSTEKVFAWSRYRFALLLAIVAVGSDFALYIIQDSEFVVRRIYILIGPILSNFYYLAEILLLAAIYWLLTGHFLSSSAPQKAPPTRFIRVLGWIHYLCLLVLFGLWIGIMYTSIRFWVARVKYDYDFKIGNTLIDLNLAFLVIYFCATIEVLVWAVIAFWKRKTEIRNLVVFLSFVAIPLLVCSCISMAIAARLEKHIISAVAGFIDTFFSRVCIVLAYGGVLFIARQIEIAQRPYMTGGIMAPPPPGLQNGHASYPTQWQQPGTQDPIQGQGFHESPGNPQMQESAYMGNVAANSPSGPWTGQEYHHPNGYVPVPQRSGGEEAPSNSFQPVPIPPRY